MRTASMLLALMILCALACSAWAADLVQPVPANSPAYKQLDLLDKYGMLAAEHDNRRIISRYDFSLALVEPLQRFVALVEARDNPPLTPLQRRRQELALNAVMPLSESEFNQLLDATKKLTTSFADIIEALSPGLPRQASEALRKLGLKEYRPWITASPESRGSNNGINISLKPKADPIGIGDPLPSSLLLKPITGPSGEGGDGRFRNALLGSKPVDSLQAAVDVAVGRLHLYGAFSTLPGDSSSELLNTSELRGKAMVGFQFNLARINDFGISGFLELHGARTGDPGNASVYTGNVMGMAINW